MPLCTQVPNKSIYYWMLGVGPRNSHIHAHAHTQVYYAMEEIRFSLIRLTLHSITQFCGVNVKLWAQGTRCTQSPIRGAANNAINSISFGHGEFHSWANDSSGFTIDFTLFSIQLSLSIVNLFIGNFCDIPGTRLGLAFRHCVWSLWDFQ